MLASSILSNEEPAQTKATAEQNTAFFRKAILAVVAISIGKSNQPNEWE
jgi:hypothetical protein